MQLTVKELRRLAARRTQLHNGQRSQRKLSVDYEFVGLIGEYAFSEWSGAPMDRSVRASGDRGVDFTINGNTIDVKTYRKPLHLPVEIGSVFADIYVLARFIPPTKAVLIGWAHGSIVSRARTKRLKPDGPINHCIRATDLRSMKELALLLFPNRR
jgi:hypothetical protein